MFVTFLFSLFSLFSLTWKEETVYLTYMKTNRIPFVYSDSLSRIPSFGSDGWIVHLLCLGGEASLVYNRRFVRISANDAMILSRPDLVSDITEGEGLRVEYIASPSGFLSALLPANHYGIGGGISLFSNPVIPLSEDNASRFHDDLLRIRSRMGETGHLFYDELMGSLARTMIYDLFDFHASLHPEMNPGGRAYVLVRRLMELLELGLCRTHRTVSYYAERLNVSPKYLSETVKRITGRSMTGLINQFTVPIIIGLLKNTDMSLTQLSEEMEFNSPSYFTRYVRKHLGVTPNGFRKRL